MKICHKNRMSYCWNASLTALPLESPPPTYVRSGYPVHAGDVVPQLASFWLCARDAAAASIWPVRSQNGYPARTLHEVTSQIPVLRCFTTTVTMYIKYFHTAEWRLLNCSYLSIYSKCQGFYTDKLYSNHLSAE